MALERIHAYLEAAGHGQDVDGPLFRPLKNPAGRGRTDRPLTHGAVYHCVLRKHAKDAGIDIGSFGPHALRAIEPPTPWTAAPTSRKVQEWLSARQRVDHPALRPAPLPA